MVIFDLCWVVDLCWNVDVSIFGLAVSVLAEESSDSQSDSDELEVSSLVDICYVDADGSEEQGLKFKVICKLHFQRFKKHCIVTKELWIFGFIWNGHQL